MNLTAQIIGHVEPRLVNSFVGLPSRRCQATIACNEWAHCQIISRRDAKNVKLNNKLWLTGQYFLSGILRVEQLLINVNIHETGLHTTMFFSYTLRRGGTDTSVYKYDIERFSSTIGQKTMRHSSTSIFADHDVCPQFINLSKSSCLSSGYYPCHFQPSCARRDVSKCQVHFSSFSTDWANGLRTVRTGV